MRTRKQVKAIYVSHMAKVTPIHDLLELTITETPLDGRTRYAKQLPVYNVDVLEELTY